MSAEDEEQKLNEEERDNPGAPSEAQAETLTPAPPARKKPYLARLLNRLGVQTGETAEWALDWLQVIVVAGLLAYLVMAFVVVRMRVPTGSMLPTIDPGDSFFVDKISYYFRQPHPGDIVVFWHHERTGRTVRYVKRLIAVGGETVQIKGCEYFAENECGIYINGKRRSDPAYNRPYYNSGGFNFCQIGAASGEHCTLSDPETVVTVPQGHYLLLGDNSRNSLDSRFWGFASKKDFIGEPFLRVWPPSRFGFMNGYFGSRR